jgi:ubiquinone/menaquinone biosynthesis C-methylase UbiE
MRYLGLSGGLNKKNGIAGAFRMIQRQAAMEATHQSNLDTVQAASAAQFDRQSDRYGKTHILANTTDVSEALSGIAANGRALDVATGGGHTALCLARMGWNVTAGDISAKMLANASQLLRDEGFALETRQFPAERIPYADATFELVTTRVAPHHFSSPEKYVGEVVRILKPGGHFLLIDGTVPDADPETEEWLHRVEKWRDPSHGRFLSRAAWEALVRKAGLDIIVSRLHPKKQPDLTWYFETAATTTENRILVLDAVQSARPAVRSALRLADEDGKIVWWWPMLRLLARKP